LTDFVGYAPWHPVLRFVDIPSEILGHGAEGDGDDCPAARPPPMLPLPLMPSVGELFRFREARSARTRFEDIWPRTH
jgi:hypothetical protein